MYPVIIPIPDNRGPLTDAGVNRIYLRSYWCVLLLVSKKSGSKSPEPSKMRTGRTLQRVSRRKEIRKMKEDKWK